MSGELLKPTLYRREGSEADPGHPALLGGACACGHVFFPMQTFGCELCGNSTLELRALTGRGRLLASAQVHLYAGKHRQAPFTVGSIALEDGPIVRTLLVEGPSYAPGDTVVTALVEVTDAEGNAKSDLRFERAR